MNQIYEKYRPRSFSEVVGQAKAVKRLKIIGDRGGYGGKAFWITGKTGTGKTTIAFIIAKMQAEDSSIIELDAQELTPKALRDLEDNSYQGSIFDNGDKHGKVYIVNEAHGLAKHTIRQLLVTLERLPKDATWIFTTTNDGERDLFDDQIDGHPLLSRCIEISITNQGLADSFAGRAKEIAETEGLGGKPEKAYITLIKRCKNNLRQVLQEISCGEMMTD